MLSLEPVSAASPQPVPPPLTLSDAALTHAAALRERCRARKLELPLLPEVAQNVRAATEGGDSNARELSDLIRRDAAFAAHVLRVANTPVYAARTSIGSLQQAISRLGLRTIGEIALVISCKTRAFSVKGYESEVRALFHHSLVSALHAREIARIRRLNVEEAFLSGLLHDVGRPTLIQALVDQLGQPGFPSLTRSEFESVVSELHEEVGAEIIAAWALPDKLVKSVRYHHHPVATDAGAALIALADDLSHLALPLRLMTDEALRCHPASGPLNLYPEDVDALIAQNPAVLGQAEAFR